MDFDKKTTLNWDEKLSWPQLLQRADKLGTVRKPKDAQQGGPDQWIFRALRPDEVTGGERKKPWVVSVSSTFDGAWERLLKRDKKGKKRWPYESRMLYEFKRQAYHYLAKLPEPDDFLEWLALARHYGMPSRLVDFTYSFPVAAYFALARRTGKDDGFTLAINITWLKDQVEEMLGLLRWRGNLPFWRASFHDPELFRRFAFESQEDYVVPVNPLRRNPRLAMQRGLFLCPGNIEESFQHNLDRTVDGKTKVTRLIRIPSKQRSTAIRELRKMNVTIATLYPDLIGWAESQGDLVYDQDIMNDTRLQKELGIAISGTPRI